MKYLTTIKKIVLYHLDMMWEKNECIVRLTVIVEEDDYVGFKWILKIKKYKIMTVKFT
jgi:hypothetical protein